ncbi:MAG: hypothetical protein HYZ31_04515 [Gammaproteobacteria bacterium]|nr:hypothetical protein [Gammaproteobacteria bacterium]
MNQHALRAQRLCWFRQSGDIPFPVYHASKYKIFFFYLRDAQGCANAASAATAMDGGGRAMQEQLPRATQEQLPRCARAAHLRFLVISFQIAGMFPPESPTQAFGDDVCGNDASCSFE